MTEIKVTYLGEPRYTIHMKDIKGGDQVIVRMIEEKLEQKESCIKFQGKEWCVIIPHRIGKRCIFDIKMEES